MKLKKLMLMILSILLLIDSRTALAGDQGMIKRLFKGDKAPYDGTLFNESALRDVDILQLEQASCEKQLHEMERGIYPSFDWEAFLFGAAVVGLGVLIVTEYKGFSDLAPTHQMHTDSGILLRF